MKLHSIEISNFKAFGSAAQVIPLKPITLLFGPNSAGKSSVLHSLLWMSSVSKTGELDVRRPLAAGGEVDLGGFRQFTHRNDPANRIRSKVSIAAAQLPRLLAVPFGIKSEVTYELTCAVITNQAQLEAYVESAVEKARADRESKRKAQAGSDDADQSSGPDVDQEIDKLIYGQSMDDFMLGQLREKLLKDLQFRFFRGDSAPYIHTISISVDGAEVLRATAKLPGPLMITILDVDFIDRPTRYADSLFSDPSDPDPMDSPSAALWLEAMVNQGLLFLTPSDSTIPNRIRFDDQFTAKWTPPDSLATDRLGSPPIASPEVVLGRVEHFSSLIGAVLSAATSSLGELAYIPPLRDLPERVGSEGSEHRETPWKTLRTNQKVRQRVNDWLASDFLRSHYEFRTDSRVSLQTLRDTLLKSMEDLVHRKRTEFEEGANDWYDELEDDPYEAFQKPVRDWDGEAEALRIYQEIESRTAPGATFEIALFDKRAGIQVSLRDVGVGISQVLPVLVESYATTGKLIAIEQPEIHIHPALQAELGDVFIESALGENKNTFLLETHSEHLILRLLRRIRETTRGKLPEGKLPITPADIAVLYVEPGEEGSVVRELRVNDQGRFIDNWPNGFFEERFNEEF